VQSVSITTKVVISNPARGEVYLIQHYAIKFVSDLHRSVVFSGSSTNKTDLHNITETLLKVALNTNKPNISENTCNSFNQYSVSMMLVIKLHGSYL
jgi:hypothetical protein